MAFLSFKERQNQLTPHYRYLSEINVRMWLTINNIVKNKLTSSTSTAAFSEVRMQARVTPWKSITTM